MKKILLSLITVIGIYSAQAQKLELGLHAGVGSNTTPTIPGGDSILPGATGFPVNYAASVKALTNIGHRVQAGVAIDFQKITYTSEKTKFIFANPAVSIYATGSWKFGRSFYIGPDIGIVLINSANYSVYTNNNKVPETSYMEPGTGLIFGYHFGFTHALSNKLDFNVELNNKYTSYSFDYVHTDNVGNKTTGSDRYRYGYGYIAVGIRVKLFTDPFRQWMPYKRVQ